MVENRKETVYHSGLLLVCILSTLAQCFLLWIMNRKKGH